jgi:hypothetical protein
MSFSQPWKPPRGLSRDVLEAPMLQTARFWLKTPILRWRGWRTFRGPGDHGRKSRKGQSGRLCRASLRQRTLEKRLFGKTLRLALKRDDGRTGTAYRSDIFRQVDSRAKQKDLKLGELEQCSFGGWLEATNPQASVQRARARHRRERRRKGYFVFRSRVFQDVAL